MRPALLLLTVFSVLAPLEGQTKRVPPAGVPVPEADRKQLEAGLGRLEKSIARLRAGSIRPDLLPDVEIYHKAVNYALRHDEFFRAEDIFRARVLLEQGQARADALSEGKAPWTTATGLVVRGYVSKIDRSVQPYSLVVPASYAPNLPWRWRLDAWFHGRGETLSEVNFIYDRQRVPGEFTPPNTIVLHLYGRYCNANKFAGEVDLFEALEAVKRHYPIDENRILVRGFSMGGAATWHIAAHHAGLWAAAAPGAGFSETPEYLKIFQGSPYKPSWWEQKLWHLYNATDYAVNFFNCPVVAYNGELDRQKQAADVMERELGKEGLRLTRVTGPRTEHRYHPDSKVTINGMIDAIAERGREAYPRQVRFTTWTLAYNKMKWVTIDALGQHWERARVDAAIADQRTVEVSTSNVTAFTLQMGPGGCTLDNSRKPTVVVDGQKLTAPAPMTDRSWTAHFRKPGAGGNWEAAESVEQPGLWKRHGLQGPIDDAFLDSFVMVKPTGKPWTPGIAQWAEAEQSRAIRVWRSQFRGDAQVLADNEVKDSDIAGSNLVLWGDPGSNAILAKIADRLPVKWTKDAILAGGRRYSTATHAVILIYPNPLNPAKYVVLNSGITFREASNASNAWQYPNLPDFAIVDTTTPPDERRPGRIALAGFFGERWELLESYPDAGGPLTAAPAGK